MSESKNSSAAAKAVAKSQKKDVVELTPIETIANVRKNLEIKWAIPPLAVAVLLKAYDNSQVALVQTSNMLQSVTETLQDAQRTIEELQVVNVDLKAKNEEFRMVYEQENRSVVFKVERFVDGDSPSDLVQIEGQTLPLVQSSGE
jgi:hypothetical protein